MVELVVRNANLAKSDGDVIMIEYQNIFTQVQVRGPAEMGVDNENNMMSERIGTPGFSNLAGWLGNAQLGPVYLGWTGVISLATGLLWFNIVGLNMLAQVGWSIPEFLRQFFWLALEPPGPEWGHAYATFGSGRLVSNQLAVLVGISLHLVVKNLSLGATA